MFLAEQRGDTEAAAKISAAIVKKDESSALASTRTSSRSPITVFYDSHKPVVITTAVGVGFVSGRRLNDNFGPVSPLELQPSTVGAGFSALFALGAHTLGYKRTRNVALAAGGGMLMATAAAHVPEGGMLARKKE